MKRSRWGERALMRALMPVLMIVVTLMIVAGCDMPGSVSDSQWKTMSSDEQAAYRRRERSMADRERQNRNDWENSGVRREAQYDTGPIDSDEESSEDSPEE